MIKNIAIGLLLLTTIFFVVFANIQAKEADKQKALATANLELAKRNEEKARNMEELATQKAAEARIEARRAEEAAVALKECEDQ